MDQSLLTDSRTLFTGLTSTTISEKGYGILKAELSLEQLEKIKLDLEVCPKVVPGYGPEEQQPFILYEEQADWIYVPRFYGIRRIAKPKMSVLLPGKSINITFAGSLRQYQRDILSAWDEHATKYGGGIISVGPGRGKTVMAIAKIAELKLKTLILVFNSDLLTQWEERIREYTPDARIGVIRGKKLAIIDKDIVIGMVQSLSNPAKDAEYPPELFAEFGMVVIDECHHIGARMFSRCLRKCAFKYTMGLSATPDRQDGLTKVFKFYLGDICFKDAGIQKTEEERLLDHLPDAEVRVYRYHNPAIKYSRELLNFQKRPNVVLMESNIANYTPRTNFILGLVPALINEGRKVIILTSRRDHIAEFLEKITAKNLGTVGPYVGGMKPEQLAESKTKQILVATYDMAEEGFDCQELDTLIMATPKRRIEQCTGRIMRKKKNDRMHIPLIIDIGDEFSTFTNWTRERCKFYKDKNYKMAEYNVDGANILDGMPAMTLRKEWPWAPRDESAGENKPKRGRPALANKVSTATVAEESVIELDLS
jgi:superfamily II DNA or RNA helicase